MKYLLAKVSLWGPVLVSSDRGVRQSTFYIALMFRIQERIAT